MRGHIALLLPDMRIGGAQRVFLILAREFINRGLRVDLIVALNDGELLAEVPSGVRLLSVTEKMPVLNKPMLAMRTVIFLVNYLRKNRPHVLLSTLTGTNLVAVFAIFLARTPTRLVLREAATFKNLRHPLYIPVMRLAYRRADALVTLTKAMQAEMSEVLRLDAAKINRIPNPIDTPRVQNDAIAALPEDFDSSRPYIIAVGRLTRQKDYETLIAAFSKLSGNESLNLVILGEGPNRTSLESLVEKLSLGERVSFRGFDANPYRWIARARLFVLSSRWEGYPNVVLEAQALGIPIVLTEYDASAREVGGEGAVLIPVADPEALAHGMRKALDSWNGQQKDLCEVESPQASYLRILGFL